MNKIAITPDEARRLHQNENLPDGIQFSDEALVARLKRELEDGAYTTFQAMLLARLVDAWTADDQDRSWTRYIQSQDSQRRAALMKVKNIFDKVGDLGFWVRSLALTVAFEKMPYANILLAGMYVDEHIEERVAEAA